MNKEQNCVRCGKPIYAGRSKYCSIECMIREGYARKRERAQIAAKDYGDCKFNSGCFCKNTSKCDDCGWNPEVARERLTAFLMKYEGA